MHQYEINNIINTLCSNTRNQPSLWFEYFIRNGLAGKSYLSSVNCDKENNEERQRSAHVQS